MVNQVDDRQVQPVNYKNSCRVATDGKSIDLNGTANPNPIDGETLNDRDRVLLKDQADPSENGVYIAKVATDPSTWERAKDAQAGEVVSSMFVPIQEGSSNANEIFVLQTPESITVGSTDLTFEASLGGGGTGDGLIYGGDIVEPYSARRGDLIDTLNIGNDLEGDNDGVISGLFAKPDGTKLFVSNVDDLGQNFLSYSLSTPWDISTATKEYETQNLQGGDNPHGVELKPDGTKLWAANNDSEVINEYILGTAWDLSTITFNQSLDLTQFGLPEDTITFVGGGELQFDDTGSILIYQQQIGYTHEFTLSTPWDISTASLTNSVNLSAFPADSRVLSLEFRPDGRKMILAGRKNLDNLNHKVVEYVLGTAWDISSLSRIRQFDPASSLSSNIVRVDAIVFRPDDGRKMLLADRKALSNPDNIISEYDTGFPNFLANGTSDGLSSAADNIKTRQPVAASGTLSELIVQHKNDFSVLNEQIDVLVNGTKQSDFTLSDVSNTVEIVTGLGISVSPGDVVSLRANNVGGEILTEVV